MADYIPPEFAQQFEALKRRQALAQMMQAQAMQQRPTEVITGHAVRQGPLSQGLRALSGILANRNLGEADAGLASLNQQALSQRQQAITQLLQQGQKDPQGAAMAGQASMDPRAQAIGKALQEQRQKQLEGYAGVIKDTDSESAARAFQQGAIPNEPYQSPSIPGPQFGDDGAGNKYAITTNRKGEQNLNYAPKQQNQQISIDAAQRKMAYETVEPNLKLKQGEATAARDVLRANGRALEAINRNAQSGGAQDIKQTFRKGLQAFGVNLPETADTEQLGMALGETLLANARKLAPVTENDMAQLKVILGSINTDPVALQRALEFTSAIAMKGMKDYQGYVKTAGANIRNPEEKGLFDAQLVGFDNPTFPGNQEQQFRQISQFKDLGGDITQFRDPTGQPFAADAQFNIAQPKPRAQPQPSKVTPLSPQEQEELNQLRARFKGGR
jgi:hypothetical protein